MRGPSRRSGLLKSSTYAASCRMLKASCDSLGECRWAHPAARGTYVQRLNGAANHGQLSPWFSRVRYPAIAMKGRELRHGSNSGTHREESTKLIQTDGAVARRVHQLEQTFHHFSRHELEIEEALEPEPCLHPHHAIMRQCMHDACKMHRRLHTSSTLHSFDLSSSIRRKQRRSSLNLS